MLGVLLSVENTKMKQAQFPKSKNSTCLLERKANKGKFKYKVINTVLEVGTEGLAQQCKGEVDFLGLDLGKSELVR